MDEHHVCLPDHLSADGLASDEHAQALIDELEGWAFWWPGAENRVMLCNDNEDEE